MKDVVETAIECEHCGEYTMFGVVVPNTTKLRAVVEAARRVTNQILLGDIMRARVDLDTALIALDAQADKATVRRSGEAE